ncbi:bile acid-CoA:amino acid N-acyltransferase-like [Tubulanus polymorphus]|uniref:bile acid-CoA:amino acid N-acyltransferase-like n=1 Tax=Tubulanus polymorphus TaxID=672921 RepID=UPI003DA3ABD4
MANFLDLRINPVDGLVDDDDILISVHGIKPFELITLSSLTIGGVKRFGAVAHYIADANGVVDTSAHVSVGGDYVGKEPHGLIWAMNPLPDQRFGTRLVHADVETPVVYQISVYKGHLNIEEVLRSDALATGELRRWYKAESVRRVRIRHGRVRGTYFIPAGKGPFPGVIDLFGIAGGIMEHRAALLASHGFATLALAYFAYEDLPKNLHEIHMDYFEEAIAWLLNQDNVRTENGVGFVGVSKGAEIISGLTEMCPEITAAVIINGYSHLLHADMMRHRKCIKRGAFFSILPEDFFNNKKGYFRFYDLKLLDSPAKRAAEFKPELSEAANYLYVASGFDLSSQPDKSLHMIQRLKDAGKTNYELVLLEGAGHLLEPPHSPMCRYVYSKYQDAVIDYGGEKRLHARAQETSWRKIINFLREKLSRPALPIHATEKSKL